MSVATLIVVWAAGSLALRLPATVSVPAPERVWPLLSVLAPISVRSDPAEISSSVKPVTRLARLVLPWPVNSTCGVPSAAASMGLANMSPA